MGDWSAGSIGQLQKSTPLRTARVGQAEWANLTWRWDLGLCDWMWQWSKLLLIHKQQATNRAAILWGNHWGGRRGGGGCGAQRAGLSNCCNFPFIILIRQLRSQWKPDARGARLPGKKYVPGVHAGSQEPPTSKLRRVNTLPRHKFGKVWGGDTVYFHSFRWVILKAIYLNTCTRKNFIWKPYSGEWNHPVTWIRASQAALVKLFVLAVRIANIQVKPSGPFRFHIVFM